ncbi:MAG: precorrin-6y C5,15-methyltransferase (decarboxylating) subunit CbiE [Rhodospirillaceae bacterium]|nr:precorrin-6y C5,15-methyltransferase (decarboxylating) subunit CbiE [Rhodospirillaceae bacterium]
MTAWLSVIGIGEDGLDGLSSAARTLLGQAELIIGGERHLAMVPDDGRERLCWPRPLKAAIPEILARRGRRVAVLATGDPMCYGVGARLSRVVSADEMTIIPALSAFSLAAARMAWSLPDIETVTLHGRPAEMIIPCLYPGARILALTADGGTPGTVARILCEQGYPDSRMSVVEQMGGPAERRIDGIARDWPDGRAAELNTLAVECIAAPGTVAHPRLPGLPDDVFLHDGQLTKREVRAATLALLAPLPAQRLWDVGAGAGSIAIEWLRSHPNNKAVAIERAPERCALIARNAAALGAPLLEVVEGSAPQALAGLGAPDAVFIGGGIGAEGLVDTCWRALPPGGRLVANVVTVEGEKTVFECHQRLGGSLTRIAVCRGEAVGPYTGWKPLMPVTQWAAVKP